jgi:catechol 2,3-dioxygenase-like lactoylglutathione lyase family enzyme
MAFKRLLCVTIAVNKIEDSLPQYTEGLGLKLMGDLHEGELGYGLRIAELGDGENVLLELLDSPGPGPVRDFLERHGEGIYQFRLETDGLYETTKELLSRGVKLVMPQPAGGGDPIPEPEPDMPLAFVHPKSTSGVLIEMYPPQN